GRMPDMKRFNVSISVTLATAFLLAFFLVPLPISRVRQTGLVQIEPKLIQKVTVPSDGRLTALHVKDGERVTRGQILAEFYSPKLEADLQSAVANVEATRARADAVVSRLGKATDSDERRQLEEDKSQNTAQVREAETKMRLVSGEIEALRRLDAPCDGIVLGAPRTEEVGKFWEKGQPAPFCQIGDPKELRLLVPVPPSDYHVLQKDMADGRRLAVSIHFPGRGSDV